jgi:hypothetical protein
MEILIAGIFVLLVGTTYVIYYMAAALQVKK